MKVKINEIVNYLEKLISFKSISPISGGAIEYVKNILQDEGFTVVIKNFDYGIESLYAYFDNQERSGPNICFAGHLDVVGAGDTNLWNSPPFMATIVDEKIYGRGAVDMKGAVAAALAAFIAFKNSQNNKIPGTISFLLTTDEETYGLGTIKMLEYLSSLKHTIDVAIIGEPTNEKEIGDTIKIGRRGSLNCTLTVNGTAGHVAYPEKALNPVNEIVKISYLLPKIWQDEEIANDNFTASNLAFTSIDTGNLEKNVIPSAVSCKFNIRFNDNYIDNTANINSGLAVVFKIQQYLEEFNIFFEDELLTNNSNDTTKRYLSSNNKNNPYKYTLDVFFGAEVFLQDENNIYIQKFAQSVFETTKIQPQFSTKGGTSDARFLKDYCTAIEFGLISETAHAIDEYTLKSHLQILADVYYNSLNELFLL